MLNSSHLIDSSKEYSLPELKRIRALKRQHLFKLEFDEQKLDIQQKGDERQESEDATTEKSEESVADNFVAKSLSNDELSEEYETSNPKIVANTEEELDLGILYKILKLCFAAKYATAAVILLTAILNLTDGFSDYTLAYYLYSSGFLNSSVMILAIDYGVFFITLSHYLMANITNESYIKIISESLFIIIFHPITPALSAISWLVARARGLEQDRPHYFTKMTAIIQGCAEAPSQLVVTSWMILVHQLDAPWNKNSPICDNWGNCIHLGVLLPVGSLALSWLSLLKASMDSFQASDTLPAVGLLLPSLLFRLGSTIILLTFMEV